MDSILDACRDLEAEKRVSFQALHNWTEVCHGREMPLLDELRDPDAEEVVASSFVLARGNGGGRFLVQKTGSILVDLYGGDPRNVPLIDVLPMPLNVRAVEACEAAVIARKPMLDFATVVLEDENELKYRFIVMPVSKDGEDADHLYGAISFRSI